ncbi:hypothetical protein [Roseovarius sp. A46]|uniref:hypothetical protein n=1 Tax=Roseovarius sp. A46 TaxID=2109331 RepID=UPI001F5044D9|nr:hypothetical protein [Roseovarius sp. A46]
MGGALERGDEGGALGGVDKREAGIVARKREITVQRRADFTEWAASQPQRMGMGARQASPELRAGRDRAGGVQCGAVPGDVPAIAGAREVQVDHPEMRGGKSGFDARRAVQRAGPDIGAGCFPVAGVGKTAVAVSGDKRVEAGQARQRARRVLHHRPVWPCVDPGMGERDHHVGPGAPDRGEPGAGGLDHVAQRQPPREMAVIPSGGLRRGEADHPDAQVARDPVAVLQGAVQDGEGWQERGVVPRRGPEGAHGIGADHRKPGLRQGGFEPVDTEVEFVIAERRGVIVHVVHGADHGVVPAPAMSGSGGQVGECRALQEIAVVEQQAIVLAHLGPRPMDECRQPSEALSGIRFAIEIIVWQEVAVYVRGGENPQRGLGVALDLWVGGCERLEQCERLVGRINGCAEPLRSTDDACFILWCVNGGTIPQRLNWLIFSDSCARVISRLAPRPLPVTVRGRGEGGRDAVRGRCDIRRLGV